MRVQVPSSAQYTSLESCYMASGEAFWDKFMRHIAIQIAVQFLDCAENVSTDTLPLVERGCPGRVRQRPSPVLHGLRHYDGEAPQEAQAEDEEGFSRVGGHPSVRGFAPVDTAAPRT